MGIRFPPETVRFCKCIADLNNGYCASSIEVTLFCFFALKQMPFDDPYLVSDYVQCQLSTATPNALPYRCIVVAISWFFVQDLSAIFGKQI